VLSSGAAPTAIDGADTLATMIERAGDGLRVVAGGGVRAHNVAALVRRRGCARYTRAAAATRRASEAFGTPSTIR
jgi:copper homeostasis protein